MASTIREITESIREADDSDKINAIKTKWESSFPAVIKELRSVFTGFLMITLYHMYYMFMIMSYILTLYMYIDIYNSYIATLIHDDSQTLVYY